jgi:hypothetical protein
MTTAATTPIQALSDLKFVNAFDRQASSSDKDDDDNNNNAAPLLPVAVHNEAARKGGK